MLDINSIKKVKSTRVHKIKNSYGLYDAYKYYRKTKPKDSKYILTSSQYSKIILEINNYLIELFLQGNNINFPKRMGQLYLEKNSTKIYEKDNKIVNTFPVDWNATLKLWEEDFECYNKKQLVKKRTDWVYKIKYDKTKANYKHKSVFCFKPNRTFKLKLKDVINNNNIDAYIKRHYE